MAFANGTAVLHLPIAGSAGASQWGTDVRKLNLAADATLDATTICNLGTGGTVRRTCDPYTTTTADLVDADYGWAVTPTDMGSVAGANRFYAAGTHTLLARTQTAPAFVAETKDFIFSAYRVGPSPTRTRTLLGSVTVAMNLTAGLLTAALSLPEIVFAADETIQYGGEMNAGGLAVTGRTVSLVTGTTSDGQSRITTPSLETLASTVGTSSGIATVSGVAAATGAMVGTSSGVATATGTGVGIGTAIGTSSGVATASGAFAAVVPAVGQSDGTSTATGAMAAVGAMVGQSDGVATAAGSGATVLGTAGSSSGIATASGALAATGAMVGTSNGVATATGAFGAVSETTGTASGTSTASGSFAVVAPTVGTSQVGAGGGETIIRRRRVTIYDRA